MQAIIDKINKMPTYQKGIILGCLLFLIAIIYYMAFYLPNQDKIKSLQRTLHKTEVDLSEKREIANNLPKFKEEVAKLDEELQKQLQKLPDKAAIPKILRTISNLGKKVGLTFNVFQPGGETARDFYAEVPLSINVTGNYHQVALFFDKVSQLSRIVNVTSVSLKSPRTSGGKTVVTVNASLVTYRFIEKN